METPICDFVAQYAKSGALRLHMPGHKGLHGIEAYDITEIDGADVLYHANGIIAQSEANAAALFGAAKTLYSTEGSSLCIRAMLYLTQLHARASGKPARIAAGRNAHKTLMTAAALLDIDLLWLYPETDDSLLSCALTAENLDRALSVQEEAPTAVYITSPDYLGNVTDLRALSAVCKKHGCLLLVDNAHGAYLRFLPESQHPMDLGADLCCDSAHKTLPVLTGGAYLHISAQAPTLFSEQAELAMSLFASTSPSYLTLQSLDKANRYLSEGYREALADFAIQLNALRTRLPIAQVGTEALKLTLVPKSYGYTGIELAGFLQTQGIVCEFSDPDFTVMMFTPTQSLQRLEQALSQLPKRPAIRTRPPKLPRGMRICSPREALFSPSEELPIEACLGKVLASTSIQCPPAIPILTCGEQITPEALNCFTYYNIPTCRTLK